MATMQIIGAVVTLPIAPYVMDRFARRAPIFFGSLIIISGAVLQGAANNMGMFLAARGLLGFGGGHTALACPALVGV